MRVTETTREILKSRREVRELLSHGFEEVTERGGRLWELHRGCRIDSYMKESAITSDGRRLFVKIEKR